MSDAVKSNHEPKVKSDLTDEELQAVQGGRPR
jgi:bacteriocin-like protein